MKNGKTKYPKKSHIHHSTNNTKLKRKPVAFWLNKKLYWLIFFEITWIFYKDESTSSGKTDFSLLLYDSIIGDRQTVDSMMIDRDASNAQCHSNSWIEWRKK